MLNFSDFKWRAACGMALISLVAGYMTLGRLARQGEVRADGNRVFELRVYHVVPGKNSALEARFREKTSKLLARHNLTVEGYWVASDSSAGSDEFIWVVGYANREEGKRNWEAMASDPEFQAIIKEEQAEKLVEKVDVTYMRPTDFSAIR
jgi:hypothetical protein